MSGLFSQNYQRCETVGRTVYVRKSEGQCRDENHCVQPDCPLERKFSEVPVSAGAPELVSRIGLGWLAGRFNK